jgi:hypothetical protein
MGLRSERQDGPRQRRILPFRKWLGVTIFVLHLLLPMLALVLVPLLGLPGSVNAILLGFVVVGGPDLLLIASIAMLGKDGVAELMSRFGVWMMRCSRPEPGASLITRLVYG